MNLINQKIIVPQQYDDSSCIYFEKYMIIHNGRFYSFIEYYKQSDDLIPDNGVELGWMARSFIIVPNHVLMIPKYTFWNH
jgi:hypothetical protein